MSQAMAAAAAAAASKGASSVKNASGKSDTAWIDVQIRTFSNWVNVQLETAGTSVANLGDDLKSGVKLCQMLEVCAKKTVGKYTKVPKMKANELENCGLVLSFLKAEGMTVVNIGPGDINDGNVKLNLGLLWTIIYNYQVAAGFKQAGAANSKTANAKDLLLEWVRSKIPEYDVKNFTTDWQDGRALCALVNVIGGEPQLLPTHRQMVPGAAHRNCMMGIDTAKEHLNVPKLIAAEDLSSIPDEHSVMTYVSFFKDAKRIDKGPKLAPSLDNEEGRKKMACQTPGCTKVKAGHAANCPEHACLHGSGCATVAVAGAQACPAHSCAHPSKCKSPVDGAKKACAPHACATDGCALPAQAGTPLCDTHGCHHPSNCASPVAGKSPFCEAHTCIHTGCKSVVVEATTWCTAHSKAAKTGALPPPWERDINSWRSYTGENLGGRCKIRVYFSTTTSSQEIRKNTQALLMLLERENVHKRPDFEPCAGVALLLSFTMSPPLTVNRRAIPVDVDMTKEKRDAIFAKANSRKTPLLFIDDEFVGDYDKTMELNESGQLTKLLQY